MAILPQKSMKGSVVAVSKDGKKAVVQTVFGQFSVLDIAKGLLEKGDLVRGYLESSGKETIVNESKETEVKVNFSQTKATRDQVKNLL
jgi:hypothetical protein